MHGTRSPLLTAWAYRQRVALLGSGAVALPAAPGAALAVLPPQVLRQELLLACVLVACALPAPVAAARVADAMGHIVSRGRAARW